MTSTMRAKIESVIDNWADVELKCLGFEKDNPKISYLKYLVLEATDNLKSYSPSMNELNEELDRFTRRVKRLVSQSFDEGEKSAREQERQQ